MFGSQQKPDQAAQVLADERHPPQVKHVERQRANPLHVAGVRVVRSGWADPTGRNRLGPDK